MKRARNGKFTSKHKTYTHKIYKTLINTIGYLKQNNKNILCGL